MEETKLQDLVDQLRAAEARYEDACKKARRASLEETEAQNALNRCQKALDNAMLELRKAAPRDTDWQREQKKYKPCA